MHQTFLYVNKIPSRIENPLKYKMHQKVLKINVRPSYNRENTVPRYLIYKKTQNYDVKRAPTQPIFS